MGNKKKIITSDDILGKEAVDPEGQVLGVVMKLHIDKESKKMVGITIDQGFMKPDLFIGMYYIKNFGVDAVFLTKVPTDKFKGMEVISSEGKIIGNVREVKAKRHKVQEIIISKKGINNTGKQFVVSAHDIQEIGGSIVLKEKYRIKEKVFVKESKNPRGKSGSLLLD